MNTFSDMTLEEIRDLCLTAVPSLDWQIVNLHVESPGVFASLSPGETHLHILTHAGLQTTTSKTEFTTLLKAACKA